MKPSIRLRLIDGLRRVIDHLTKEPMEVLRRPNIHAEAAGNLNELLVARVPYDAAERQIDDAEILPSFKQGVGVLNRHAIVANFQPLITHRQVISGPNHYLIAHQKPPFGKNYLPSLPSKAGSVEGAI